jgi:hypothetical protein
LFDFKSIIDIDSLGLDPGGADHFHLLGFAVMERGGVLKSIEMIFVESLFCHRWTELTSTYSKLCPSRAAHHD